MFLDDSACNLASINLMKFVTEDGEFDTPAFEHACRTFITAQEILVDNASYPTPAIGRNSRDYRPLGLGYANLGALLMSRGLPYDSDAGRDYSAAITAVMHGAAYAQSARVARDHGGPFPGYAKNREPMLRVMRKHRAALKDIDRNNVPKDLFDHARATWDTCIDLGEQHGYRNAQATVLAPTGTIGFMMDCDTTGVEPDIALVKYKKLVGGGLMKIVNNTVPMALAKLGYTPAEVKDIIGYIDEHETIEGAPHLKDADLPVFDCAFKPAQGVRSIHYMGHIKMMGAVQPFISGAISKTVNVPKAATVEEIEQAYIDAWRIGAKAVSIYRDGSKRTQPLNTSRDKEKGVAPADVSRGFSPGEAIDTAPRRHRLPDERQSITHKFDIGGHEGYITVGLYEDGQPGELFLTMAKEGSTISGFADAFAQAISYALQYGVPLQDLVDKFSHVRFEPAGMTRNPDIRFAKSIVDYIFRWLAAKFLSPEAQYRAGLNVPEVPSTPEQLVLDVAASASAAGAFAAAATADKSAASAGESAASVGKSAASVGKSAASAGKPASQAASAARPPATASQAASAARPPATASQGRRSEFAAIQNQEDAPPCTTCGSIMVRSGACYKCANCGTTSGCA
jgi:ribonucleoside-diphosphate reductase alpha chain